MSADQPPIDPWVSLSRIVAGVILYGAVGFGLDLWWGTSFMIAIGIVFGAASGTFLVYRSLQDST